MLDNTGDGCATITAMTYPKPFGWTDGPEDAPMVDNFHGHRSGDDYHGDLESRQHERTIDEFGDA